jgi:hypothetical protein
MPVFDAPPAGGAGAEFFGNPMMSTQEKIFAFYKGIVLPIAVRAAAIVFVERAASHLVFGERGLTGFVAGTASFIRPVDGSLAGTIEVAPEQPPPAEVILPAAPPPESRPANEQVFDATKDPVDVVFEMPPMWLRDP